MQYNTKIRLRSRYMKAENSKLIIGISSRALFNLDESHKIYKKEGLKSYQDYQIENEDTTLNPGEAFSLDKKILRINDLCTQKRLYRPLKTTDLALVLSNKKE